MNQLNPTWTDNGDGTATTKGGQTFDKVVLNSLFKIQPGDWIDAAPAIGLDKPPYRAELFIDKNCLAGVVNRENINCLTFPGKSGLVFTSIENAREIAERWNNVKNIDAVQK